MGAPEVIAAPSKSYVAINSFKSDRSVPPTLCDLGRVSSIAAVITLPRISNFVNRNNVAKTVGSLPSKKRPISDVMDYQNSRHENTTTEISTTNNINAHKRRRYALGNQLNTLNLATPCTLKSNFDRKRDSSSKSKIVKLKSTDTSSMVSSSDVAASNNKKPNLVSHPQNTQNNSNIQVTSFQSTTTSPQKFSRQPIQIYSQINSERYQHVRAHGPISNQLANQQTEQLPTPCIEQPPPSHSYLQVNQETVQLHSPVIERSPTAHSNLQRNQHAGPHSPIKTQLPNQHNVQLPTPVIGKLATHLSLPLQLQLQNQQLRNKNVQLQKQLSLFRQLIKNPQRLNQVLATLEQRAH